MLLQLIEDTTEEDFPGLSMSNGLKMCFLRSDSVSAIKCPIAKDINGCGKIQVVKCRIMVMQRIFPTHTFLYIWKT